MAGVTRQNRQPLRNGDDSVSVTLPDPGPPISNSNSRPIEPDLDDPRRLSRNGVFSHRSPTAAPMLVGSFSRGSGGSRGRYRTVCSG